MAQKSGKQPEWADSLKDIQQNREMNVTLLSGAKVTLRTVTLDELAVEDAIPGDLLEVAILDSADLLLPRMLEEIRNERVDELQRLSARMVDLADRVALKAIVAPQPAEKVVAALDGFDKKMVLEIAQRKRSTDAVGKVVAAQALGDFEGFREEPVSEADRGDGGGDGEVAAPVA